MMRTYGRVYQPDGSYQWVEVTTDGSGQNDAVYITTLIQVLKLNRNESPFYANFGIPSQASVATQIPPDIYVSETQQQFSGYFASLLVFKVTSPTPTYNIRAITHAGATIEASIPV